MSEEYCTYLRKSRVDVEAEARGEKDVLARHEAELLRVAKWHKLSVTKIYREIVSGENIASRPVVQEMLSEVEQGRWAGVLVMEVERLARGDTIDQGIIANTFKYSNTKIVTPMKVYDPNNEYDEEYFEFGLFMSRREYKTINRRLQRGRLASVREGKYAGNKTPYGYTRVKIKGEKGWTLEPNPEQAPIVALMFDWYINGAMQDDGSKKRLGVSLICRKLNELNVPTMTGKPWVPATVQAMIRNPVYAGKIRWNSRPTVKHVEDGTVLKTRPRAKTCDIYQGLHTAIITQEIFDLAQKLLTKNPPRPVGEHSVVKNPLSGLIVCSECGRKMVRRPYGSGYPDTLMCPLVGCPTVSCVLSVAEQKVLDGLETWVKGYKLHWNEASVKGTNLQEEFTKKAAKKAANELEQLCGQMSHLHDLLERDVYTVDVFLERSHALTERIDAARAEKKILDNQVLEFGEREIAQKEIIPKVEHLLEVYRDLDSPAAKNDTLKEVLEKVIYVKTMRERWATEQNTFELTLYPKVPDFICPHV